VGVLIVSDERMLAHDPGPSHPEGASRLVAIEEALAAADIPGLTRATPAEAPRSALAMVHTAAYLDLLEGVEGTHHRLDPDTCLSPGSGRAARLSAGAALEAVARVHVDPTTPAFALTRPPGHHALPDRAMGFCVYANAAIAASFARQLGYQRVWVVDWDVHHGNGTQAAFHARSDVLFCSTHQEAPFWPATGHAGDVGFGAGLGYTVNVPLPIGATDADHVAAFERLLVPIATQFAPDFVIVSAGFDPHRDDPLGQQKMTEEGFAALCGCVRSVAARSAGGRVVAVLEGGYDLGGTARSAAAVAAVLAGAMPPAVGAPRPVAERAIREAARCVAPYWEGL
jgi:acetoin utilization deacetylase AcuC-like enzyme